MDCRGMWEGCRFSRGEEGKGGKGGREGSEGKESEGKTASCELADVRRGCVSW